MANKLKGDNQGATLVLVMIAMAFVGILGAAIVSMSLTNYKIKAVDRQAKDNFYETEAVMDEIKAKVESRISEEISRAYQQYLSSYLNIATEEQRKEAFRDWCLNGVASTSSPWKSEGVIKALGGSSLPSDLNWGEFLNLMKTETDPVNGSKNKYYVTALGNTEGNASILTKREEAKLQVDAVRGRVTLKNVKVAYEEKGYRTTITADIVTQTPSLTGGKNLSTANAAFQGYSLIADDQILVENGSGNETKGNVYAGEGGIVVKALEEAPSVSGSYHYSIGAEKIITRGDIKVVDHGWLNLGAEASGGVKPDIWAQNIITEKEKAAKDSTKRNKLDIEGICYIANDMKINKKKSTVAFHNDSEYYGYNYNEKNKEGEVPASQYSSAIFVNGADSSLDLKGLYKLSLSGRAFISAAQAGGAGRAEFPTGESLSTKSIQLAYLVPNEYITDDIKINPMPLDSYTPYETNLEGLLKIQQLKADGIYSYLNQTAPVVVIFPNLPTSYTPMAYCYYNFKNQQAAADYFKEYYNRNTDDINQKAGYYLTGAGIEIDQGSMGILQLSGNGFIFGNGTSALIPEKMDPDHAGSHNYAQARRLGTRYSNITKTLDENRGSQNSPSIFETVIDTSQTAAIPSGTQDFLEIDFDGDGIKDGGIYVINNKGGAEFILDPSVLNGIVAATGDVLVQDSFQGVILSGGTIKFENNNMVTAADEDLVKRLLEYDLSNEKKVVKYFKGYLDGSSGSASGSASGTAMSDWVYFENWIKNEE